MNLPCSPYLTSDLHWSSTQKDSERGCEWNVGIPWTIRRLSGKKSFKCLMNTEHSTQLEYGLCWGMFSLAIFSWNVQLQKIIKYLHHCKWNICVSFFCHNTEYYVQQMSYFPWGSDTKLFSIQRTINRLLQLYVFWSRSFPVFSGDACPIAAKSAVCQASQ